jgi:predicted MFS family arabinose efflux permease
MADRAGAVSGRGVLLLAAAAGVAVANIYYVQPLLQLIADDFHASARSVGLVAVMMQLGYAVGILAFVPLGDIVQPRRLLTIMFAAVTVMLACGALAPGVAALAAATLAIGICTTCAQILMPFAADFAPAPQRGRVIGTIQTGLLVGMLFARVGGGLLGAHLGWRSVFWCAAALSALAALVLARVMPLRPARAVLGYRDLLASIVALVGRHPTLRASMGLGAMAFAIFGGVWTVLAFQVHDLGYGADVVGYLGALSLGSALGAHRFGMLCDRRGTLFTGTLGWLLLLLACGAYAALGHALWGLVVASAFLPLGVSLTQISNQTRIFALDDTARSRLNTAYMFTIFSGGALGALGATIAWQRAGWSGVCILLLAFVAAMAPLLAWYARLGRDAVPSRTPAELSDSV